MSKGLPPLSDLTAERAQEGLGRRAVRGSVIVLAAMAVQKVIALAAMAVLARLVTPGDYGLVGMVASFMAFLQVFEDLGLTWATVQKAEIRHEQVSILFWANVVFGVLLWGVASACAPLLARLYGEPGLIGVTLWLAAGFPVTALGAQHVALMVRGMRFKRLAVCETVALLAGAAVGVTMALKGQGPYAIVAQTLVQSAVRSMLAWALSGWLPGRPVRGSGVREMLRWGGYLTGFNLLNTMTRHGASVFLGLIWGPVAVGLFSRAYTLMMFPMLFVSSPIGTVAVPALVRVRSDAASMVPAYLRLLKVVALLTFPMMAFVVLEADLVIMAIYGRTWADTIPVFRALCVAGMLQGVRDMACQLFIAAGRSDRLFRSGVVYCPLMLVAVAVGSFYGAVAAAYCYAAMFTLVMPFYLRYAYATIGLPLRVVAKELGGLLAAAVLSLGVCVPLRAALPEVPDLLLLALLGAAYCATYVAVLYIFLRPVWRETVVAVVSKLLSERLA